MRTHERCLDVWSLPHISEFTTMWFYEIWPNAVFTRSHIYVCSSARLLKDKSCHLHHHLLKNKHSRCGSSTSLVTLRVGGGGGGLCPHHWLLMTLMLPLTCQYFWFWTTHLHFVQKESQNISDKFATMLSWWCHLEPDSDWVVEPWCPVPTDTQQVVREGRRKNLGAEQSYRWAESAWTSGSTTWFWIWYLSCPTDELYEFT